MIKSENLQQNRWQTDWLVGWPAITSVDRLFLSRQHAVAAMFDSCQTHDWNANRFFARISFENSNNAHNKHWNIGISNQLL